MTSERGRQHVTTGGPSCCLTCGFDTDGVAIKSSTLAGNIIVVTRNTARYIFPIYSEPMPLRRAFKFPSCSPCSPCSRSTWPRRRCRATGGHTSFTFVERSSRGSTGTVHVESEESIRHEPSSSTFGAPSGNPRTHRPAQHANTGPRHPETESVASGRQGTERGNSSSTHFLAPAKKTLTTQQKCGKHARRGRKKEGKR